MCTYIILIVLKPAVAPLRLNFIVCFYCKKDYEVKIFQKFHMALEHLVISVPEYEIFFYAKLISKSLFQNLKFFKILLLHNSLILTYSQ